MEILLLQLLAYLINLAAGLRTGALLESQRKKIQEALEKEEAWRFGMAARQPLREQLQQVAGRVVQLLEQTDIEKPLKDGLAELLNDSLFPSDLAEWLGYWDLRESEEAKGRLQEQMTETLSLAHVASDRIKQFVDEFFNAAENVVFADGRLAHWRHQVTLNVICEQHAEILERVRARDGVFEPQRLEQAFNTYRDSALKTHDIMDLHGLPEDDRHLALQAFVLRQLYIPLRIEAEPPKKPGETEPGEKVVEGWETERARHRLLAAGRIERQEHGNKPGDRRTPVGELLAQDRRLVILADPGGGKTTLMRWFATAYLLRLKNDPALSQLPDVATLPDADWLPILIRCRELPRDPHLCAFDEILEGHISQLNISGTSRDALKALFRQRIEEGTALLIIDGLDEIQDPMLRARFCRRLETLATLYDRAPMIATSRIVGYREMPFRLGCGFRHGTITELTRDDMDEFAKRWAIATEPASRRDETARDLTRNIHSSERVERLAGNPMLLTTLALIHRKIGRLPQKRHELYREALKVLLNWRGEIDEPLDWDEAVPQLEYVAYAMCRDGIQQLPRDRILDLLDEMREAYGKRLRDIEKRTPAEFLSLLENRSSLLIQAGHARLDGREIPVYEFRHLTFQEYLAALALVDGRFPGHKKDIRLPERIAPLAGSVQEQKGQSSGRREHLTAENWREPLRLCLAECSDDDADDALMAILRPAKGEKRARTARPRAIMAALCLADEPNVSEEIADKVFSAFAAQVQENDGQGHVRTALDAAAMEVARCAWAPHLRAALVREFKIRPDPQRGKQGGLCGMMGCVEAPETEPARMRWLEDLVSLVAGDDEDRVIQAALTVMLVAYEGKAQLVPGLVSSLLSQLERSTPVAHAAAWALGWLARGEPGGVTRGTAVWRPHEDEIAPLLRLCSDDNTEERTLRFSMWVLSRSGDIRAVAPLTARLHDTAGSVRLEALIGLAKLKGLDEIRTRLLRSDPQESITVEHVQRAAKELERPEAEIRAIYEELAPDFKLRLSWKSQDKTTD